MDILERLRFDAMRCEATFSKGVATNIEAAVAEIERLRAALTKIKAITTRHEDGAYEWSSFINEIDEITNEALLSSK